MFRTIEQILCRLKLRGGLGFRDLEDFNFVLQAKQIWWLVHVENALVLRVLKVVLSELLNHEENSLAK